MITQDFDAMTRVLNRPSFTICGQEFTARKKIPYKSMQLFLNELSANDYDATVAFFRKVLIPKDRQRFVDLVEDEGLEEDEDDSTIGLTQMQAIIKWLMALYTGQDAPKDENSSPGPATTGEPSKIVSLNAVQAT